MNMRKLLTSPAFLAVVVGLSLGLGAAYGDTILNNGQVDLVLWLTNYLNTASAWTLAAFFIGSRSKSWKLAAVPAVAMLLIAVCSYYFYGVNFGNRTLILQTVIMREVAIWSLLGVVIGTVYGIAGSLTRFSATPKLRIASVSLVSVMMFAENGFFFLRSYPYANLDLMSLFSVILGIILPFLLLRNYKQALLAIGLAIIPFIAGVLALQSFFSLIR